MNSSAISIAPEISLGSLIVILLTFFLIHVELMSRNRVSSRMLLLRLPFTDKMIVILAKGYNRFKHGRLEVKEINSEDRRASAQNTFFSDNLRKFNSPRPFRITINTFDNPKGQEYDTITVRETKTSNGISYKYENVPLARYNSNSKEN